MKNIGIVICMALGVIIFGQENEFKNAKNQFNSKNYKGTISTTQSITSNFSSEDIDPKLLVELYNLQGTSYMELGDIANAANSFARVSNMEENPIFWVKNKEDKSKHYFYNKADAEKYAQSIDSNVKEMTLEKIYSPLIYTSLSTKLEPLSQEANNSYNKKDYKNAATKFEETYQIMNALQRDGNPFLYYAAISAYQAGDIEKAQPLFQKIIDLQYEGEDPKDNPLETSYRLMTFLFSEKEDWDSVKKYAEEGLKKFPDNADLKNALSTTFSKTGDDEAFIEQLKKNIADNPKDANSLYNLGVMFTKDNRSLDNAFDYFTQALQYDSGNQDIYDNIIYVIGEQIKAVRGDETATTALYKKLIPVLEQARAQFPQEKSYVSSLKISYGQIGDDDNYDKYSALEKTMN